MLAILLMASMQGAADAAIARDTAELARIVARHRTPVTVQSGQPPLPGIFSTQKVEDLGDCRIGVTDTVPAFTSPSYSNPQPISAYLKIDLSTMDSWVVRDTAVSIAPSHPRLRMIRTASAADAAKVKTLLDRLALACHNSVPQPDPPNTGAVTDRVAIRQGKDYRICKFRHVPGLSLTEQKPYPRYSYFAYNRGRTYVPEILIVERDDHIYDHGADSSYVQWGALRVIPRFSLTNSDLEASQMVWADVTVDGRPIAARWTVIHNKSRYGSGFAQVAKVELSRATGREHGKVAAAMAAGRSVTLTLHDAAGATRTYTFDVSTLRDMPRALEGAQFRCA